MNTLQVGADSLWIVRAGAATLLAAHIAGGSMAILSGAVALAVRKGSPLHVQAGRTFFVSMLAMASIGGLVAPFLVSRQGDPKYFDSLAGFFTLYLVVTGWMTLWRKAGTIGRAEGAAFLCVSSLAAAAVLLGLRAASSASGLAGGQPAGAYYGFAGIFALAAILDAKVLLNRGISGGPRLARHVWRMSLAMFVATGSFFLGQQRVMPDYVQDSAWLQVPPLAVLAIMAFWLLKLRLAGLFGRLKRRRRTTPHDAAVPARAVS